MPTMPKSSRIALQSLPKSATRKVFVTKRDGTKVEWNAERITRAVALAFFEAAHEQPEKNTLRNSPELRYGLSPKIYSTKVEPIAKRVIKVVIHLFEKHGSVDIETIQDCVERELIASGELEVAHLFMTYRQKRSLNRLNRYPENGMSDFVALSKYSQYREDLQRREVFPETVARVRNMHLEFFKDKLDLVPDLKADTAELTPEVRQQVDAVLKKTLGGLIQESFAAVEAKKILPSMRSLQFGGKAIMSKNPRIYNCSYSLVNRWEIFREYLYLLLCGTGVGVSVQQHHVAQLSALPKRLPEQDLPVVHFSIPDTIEGWADALDELLKSYREGYKVEFNYGKIRPRGAPLKTSGGKAPGHIPLRNMLRQVEKILDGAAGRQLRPIET